MQSDHRVQIVDAASNIYSYDPAKGHGLRHDPFYSIVGPRPIGWISSRDGGGRSNLAPYSFFNAFCDEPYIIGFCSNGWKDTVSNIAETREFVWNLATRPNASAMNASSASVPHEVDEFVLAGFQKGSKHSRWRLARQGEPGRVRMPRQSDRPVAKCAWQASRSVDGVWRSCADSH
jgi:Flavin reductase like domain